jgi:hypothetical protein
MIATVDRIDERGFKHAQEHLQSDQNDQAEADRGTVKGSPKLDGPGRHQLGGGRVRSHRDDHVVERR